MKQKHNTYFDLILLAAGRSERMGFEKQFAIINELPIWQIALENVRNYCFCKNIIVVFPKNMNINQNYFNESKQLHWVHGGNTRSQSVWNALLYLNSMKTQNSYIAIHDAARPIVPHNVLDRMTTKLKEGEKAVIPVLNATDTIKTYSENYVTGTLNRDELVTVQTPQIFESSIIQDSYRRIFAKKSNLPQSEEDMNTTDDSSFVEANGIKVAIVPGSPYLTKLTFKKDFNVLKQLLEPISETRTATGYDVHKFRPWATNETERNIRICGVEVEHEYGIDAHSDGDVGIHALCDAIFGCLADGDIGSHFPPSENKWKNADSKFFLDYAINKIKGSGGKIILLDVTIICETPKIGPKRQKMKERLAEICNLPIERVSVKATTSEKLGFTGRNEGISAFATATLSLSTNSELIIEVK